ncbi:RhaT Permeases of the drug/metabolite transporter (DMT) superfamily [actinobacterium SCGC AAA044-D11]|jgi:drug/metabolite transporter (DMT)-like permease
MKQKSWVPIYLALGLVWGCSFIFIKLGLEFLTPVGVAFGRCALGAMALLLIVKVRGIKLPTERSTWAALWLVSLLLNVFPGILFAYAEQRVTSVLAGIINAGTPLTTLIFLLIFFRTEKIAKHQIIGLILGGLGVLTVLGIWKGIGSSSASGVIALLAAITCYGLSFPVIRKYLTPLKLRAEALAAGQVTAGALTLLPFYLFNGIAKDEYRMGPILAMIALGVFGSGLAYIWNFQIVERAGSSIASTVTYLTPVVAVFVGWIFLGEHISWHEPLGGAIVLLGAATSQGRFTRKAAK